MYPRMIQLSIPVKCMKINDFNLFRMNTYRRRLRVRNEIDPKLPRNQLEMSSLWTTHKCSF